MSEAQTELLKRAFPELRKLEGRFLGLFIAELRDKVEDWAIWAMLQLGKIKCYDVYRRDVLCLRCKHFDGEKFGGSCEKHPEIGQTWEGEPKEALGHLTHPNTGEWYWCIRECPDFERKETLT